MTQSLDEARAEAKAAADRFQATLSEARDRLAPSSLAHEALERANDASQVALHGASLTVRQNPWPATVLAAFLALIVFRRPLFRLFGRRSIPASDGLHVSNQRPRRASKGRAK